MARTDQDSDEAGLLSPKLLRLMESLHTTRSVTRTAEKLGQTQSTVSILLARARAQLGDPLFVRTPEGMLPTPRTDALMPKVQKVLEYLRDMAAGDAGFEPATSKREFRIIMTDASHITMLPRLFSHVRAMAPKIRLEAATIDAGMADSLQSGHCHLAIGQLPALEAGFYRQTLHGQDWICLANAGHPRIGQRFTVKDYLAEAHVGIASGTGPMVDEALKQQGLQREVLLELPGFLGLAGILSASDLVATLPRHIGETLSKTAGLRVLKCPVKIVPITISQYWHARYHQDAASRWLRGICVELFGDAAAGLRARK